MKSTRVPEKDKRRPMTISMSDAERLQLARLAAQGGYDSISACVRALIELMVKTRR